MKCTMDTHCTDYCKKSCKKSCDDEEKRCTNKTIEIIDKTDNKTVIIPDKSSTSDIKTDIKLNNVVHNLNKIHVPINVSNTNHVNYNAKTGSNTIDIDEYESRRFIDNNTRTKEIDRKTIIVPINCNHGYDHRCHHTDTDYHLFRRWARSAFYPWFINHPCPQCPQPRPCPPCPLIQPCPPCPRTHPCPSCPQINPCPSCPQIHHCPPCPLPRTCPICPTIIPRQCPLCPVQPPPIHDCHHSPYNPYDQQLILSQQHQQQQQQLGGYSDTQYVEQIQGQNLPARAYSVQQIQAQPLPIASYSQANYQPAAVYPQEVQQPIIM